MRKREKCKLVSWGKLKDAIECPLNLGIAKRNQHRFQEILNSPEKVRVKVDRGGKIVLSQIWQRGNSD